MRGKAQPTTPAFTRDEWNLFLKYTGLLVDLCNKTIVDGGFDGVTSKAFPCPLCARRVPAGVPVQMMKSEWAACPACIKARALVTAVEKQIYGFAASSQRSKPSALEAQEVLDAARQRAKPVLAPFNTERIEKQIKIEEERMQKMADPDLRMGTQRLIDALKTAMRMASGGQM